MEENLERNKRYQYEAWVVACYKIMLVKVASTCSFKICKIYPEKFFLHFTLFTFQSPVFTKYGSYWKNL